MKVIANSSKKSLIRITHPWVAGSFCALAAFALLVSAPTTAKAQSDNFDSGTLSPSWTVLAADPSLYNLSFPTVGTGKGLRVQASPYPGAVPGAAGLFQTNVYTDFYVALDLVNWALQDQSVVLFGRFTPGGSFGLDGGQGIICNYDVWQTADATENPPAGDRYGGEFQINTITPPFNAGTLASCEMTLVPGHSYRMILKSAGQVYTAQMYDWNDLTKPLATLQGTDTGALFTSGQCGILSFSRAGTGANATTDATIDNYYAGASDPNLATPPALMHPIPGTPIVETRSPTNRWQNFYNPASGISFTAKTYTASVINSAATKLVLNGKDVSSQLTLSPNGTVVTGSLPGAVLKSNSLYSAQITLADTTGLLTSTNTFWFDTFSDAYLASAAVETIECEDYNYSNGVFQLDPIAVSGMVIYGPPFQANGDGVGYFDSATTAWETLGTSGVDYVTASGTSPNSGWDDYRPNDAVMTGEGIRQEIEDDVHPDVSGINPLNPWDSFVNVYTRPNDNTRQKYAVSNLVEYLVIRTHAGDWLNYTRKFTSSTTNYFVFLRAGSFYSTSNTLSMVTSDPTQPSQTTSVLGTFNVPNLIRKGNFQYIPLLDTNGVAPILSLSGTNTLRLTTDGTATVDDRVQVLNYLLLVPAQVGLQSSPVVAGPYTDEATATVNVNARTVSISAAGTPKFYRLEAAVPLTISGVSVAGGTVTIRY